MFESKVWSRINRQLTRLACLLLIGISSATANAQDSMLYPIDTVAAPDGTIYVADRKLPGIWQINDGTTSLYFQAEKQFGTPLNAIRCLAIDQDGHLLAGDSATFGVYRFDEAGQPTKVHDGRIGVPMGIACASDGTIFVSDSELHRIFKISPAADGAMPTAEMVATVGGPRGLCIDDEDRLWISSARDGQVKRMDPATGELTTIVEGLPFQYPAGIAFLAGNIYLVDSFADTVFRITEGSAPEAFAEGEPFVHPVGVSVRDGKLIVADSRANTIFELGDDGARTALATGN